MHFLQTAHLDSFCDYFLVFFFGIFINIYWALRTVWPLVSVLKSFNKVVNDCFTSYEISSETRKDITNLRKDIQATGLSETLKLHTIMYHLEDCLDALPNNKGLGFWSEQAGEAVHREFLKHWSKFKINLLTDKSYPKRLRKAVVEFSSMRI